MSQKLHYVFTVKNCEALNTESGGEPFGQERRIYRARILYKGLHKPYLIYLAIKIWDLTIFRFFSV